MRAYLGIDPGVAGGIACVREDGAILGLEKMPETPAGLVWVLRQMSAAAGGELFAVVERVNAGVFAAGRKMGVVSAFTFGRGFGRIETAVAAMGTPADFVAPATWQKAMGCQSHGDKNVTKRRAAQLFPSVKMTHAIADALLLAEFGRRYWITLSGGTAHSKESEGEEEGAGAVQHAAAEVDEAAGAAADAVAGHGRRPQRPARSSVRGDRGRARRDQSVAGNGTLGRR